MQRSLAHSAPSNPPPVSSRHACRSRLESARWVRSHEVAREAALEPVVEPLVDGWDKLGVDVPILVLDDHDLGPLEGGSKHDHRRRVCEQIADVPVVVSSVWLGSLEVLVVRGAAEKVFDEAFLREASARLAARTLAVAVPAKDLLVVAALEPDTISRLADEVARLHRDADAPLSPTLFEVEGGKLVGVVQDALVQKDPSRGLLGRLLGGRRLFH